MLKTWIIKLVSEAEEIENFFPNKESYKLSSFLSFLYFECGHFEVNFDEEELYISIQDAFLKFQNFFVEYKTLY